MASYRITQKSENNLLISLNFYKGKNQTSECSYNLRTTNGQSIKNYCIKTPSNFVPLNKIVSFCEVHDEKK